MPTEETVMFAADEIASQAQPLPRDWARLIQKLRWIGLTTRQRSSNGPSLNCLWTKGVS
jgi:hypothetical protein